MLRQQRIDHIFRQINKHKGKKKLVRDNVVHMSDVREFHIPAISSVSE